MKSASLLLLAIGAVLVLAPIFQSLVTRSWKRFWGERADNLRTAGCIAYAVGNAMEGEWTWTAWWSALAITGIIFWWRRRRKRRGALAALGAKGRARIAAMVSAMRERAKPRPALKPQRSPA